MKTLVCFPPKSHMLQLKRTRSGSHRRWLRVQRAERQVFSPERRSVTVIRRWRRRARRWRWKRLTLGWSTSTWQSGCRPTVTGGSSPSSSSPPGFGDEGGALRKMCLSTTPPLDTANAGIGASASASATAMSCCIFPPLRSLRVAVVRTVGEGGRISLVGSLGSGGIQMRRGELTGGGGGGETLERGKPGRRVWNLEASVAVATATFLRTGSGTRGSV